MCIGAQFALSEAVLALARLCAAFRIELASDAPILPVAVVTTQPENPGAFRLHSRD